MPTTVATSPTSGSRWPMSRPPSTPDRPTASQPTSRSAATSSLLTTPAEHGRGDLERRGIGDPQPALEVRRDAEPLEPLGHALAAAVDEHDRPTARDRGDLGEHLPLVRERRPAQLDDDDLAHVVYSEFSRTYSSVRSQPKASPVPSPSPRSRRIRTSSPAIAALAAALSTGTGTAGRPS